MRKKNLTRNIIIGVVIFIVLLVILRKTGVLGTPESTEVETSKVTRQTIIETVNASGKVQPEKEIKISADISGEITALPVKEGDRVKKGDLLARIKPDAYQRGVEKAEAAVNTSRAQLAGSKATYAQSKANFEKVSLIYNRNKKLFEQNAITKADWENTQSEYKVAQAQLEGAEESVKASQYNLATAIAGLKEAQDALKKTAIFSPMEGIVSKLNVELGERVVGTMQMAGTEMMRIANLAAMQVEVDVNENDIVRLKNGDTADIEIDAFRGDIFKGIVTEISSSSETGLLNTDKVTNFKVKIRILESSYRHLLSDNSALPTPFRPGMSASVAIQTSRAEKVLSVPILAVTVRNAAGVRDSVSSMKDKEVVFLYNNGKVKQKAVKTGIQDDERIEIKDGLSEGDEVVSGPYRLVSKTLKDGEEVTKSKGKKSDSKG